MADSKFILQDDHYVGERLYVEVRLFDEITDQQARDLVPLLRFTRPDKTIIAVVMDESEQDPGLYIGDAVLDAQGKWRIEVSVGTESLFRHDRIYVAA